MNEKAILAWHMRTTTTDWLKLKKDSKEERLFNLSLER